MLEVSPELAAAIEAPEQDFDVRAYVDWDKSGAFDGADDKLPHIGDVSVEQALEGMYPAAVQVVEGMASSELQIGLVVGDGTEEDIASAVSLYSELNADSPLYGYERHARPVKAEIGYLTDNGREWLPLGPTSSTTDMPVDGEGVSLTALDAVREKLAKSVDLPIALADAGDSLIMPGLNAQWVIDYILRQCGVYASPPPLEQCAASVTLHGSCWPEVGTIVEARILEDDEARRPTFSQGRFALSLDGYEPPDEFADKQRVRVKLDPAHPFSQNPGQTWTGSCWVYAGETTTAELWSVAANVSDSADAEEVLFRLFDGELTATVGHMPSDSLYEFSTVDGPALTGADAWHFIGVKVTYDTSGVYVTWYVDDAAGVEFSNSLTEGFHAPNFQHMVVRAGVPMENVQVSASATPRNDYDFEPTAELDPSINELVAVKPTTGIEAWEELGNIVRAELGTMHTSATDVLRFWSRRHWSTEAAQTVVGTLTTEQNLLELGYDSGVHQIGNKVSMPVTPVRIGAEATVWQPSGTLSVAPQSSFALDLEFSDPVFNLRTPFLPGSSEPDAASWYQANDAADGSGSISTDGISIVVESYSAMKARIRITNTNTWTKFFVDDTGESYFQVRGTPILSESDGLTDPVLTDDASIAKYGERPLGLPDSPWVQTRPTALGIISAAIVQIAHPAPRISKLIVVGDPRRELGDRCIIRDTRGTRAAGEYWITAKTNIVGAAFTQQLEARRALDVLIWGSGQWGNSLWGS